MDLAGALLALAPLMRAGGLPTLRGRWGQRQWVHAAMGGSCLVPLQLPQLLRGVGDASVVGPQWATVDPAALPMLLLLLLLLGGRLTTISHP